jgi:N-acetyl-beta-hexosaminidase
MLPELAKGRKLILSSMNQFYCDYSYADIPLKATLMYEPEVKGTPVQDENVLGVEAPMWTEWTPTNEDIERMIYPRLHALAECGWTRERDYDNFLVRLKEYMRVEALNLLKGMPWEDATIHGQAALDMIVGKMIELAARFGRMQEEGDGKTEGDGKAEAAVPDGDEQTKADSLEAIKGYIFDKMKAAYSEEEIKQVQDRLIQMRK